MSILTRRRRRGTDRLPDWVVADPRVVFVESIVVLAVVWWVVATAFDATEVISSPALVGLELSALLASGEWVPHMVDTTRRVVYGFVLTVLVGTVIGVGMGWSDTWKRALQDYIAVGLALPSLFSAIFAAMWFGVSDVTPMVAAALISFPFLTQNVYEGVQGVDRQSILPEWFGGVRYAFALCWKITALAELVAAESGIGYMIETQLNLFSLSGVLAWTALFTALMLVVEYGVLQPVENRMFGWREDSSIGWV
jgi:ABC-type nitrate/sulfonate/bicarbonate transport system permease component